MVTENTGLTEDLAQTEPAEVDQTTAEQTPATDALQFTSEQQAYIDRINSKTRRDERNKFKDYNDLKARAARADELEQAQLTEAEKMEARAIEAEKKVTDAQQQIADAMISSQVKVRASQMGVVDPDAAYLLLDRTNVQYADGAVTGVDDAIASLLEDKPYLRGTNRTPNINPESGQPVQAVRLTDLQLEAARMMGLTAEEYAQGL
jgi:hypothetical protein|tara:strand:+ start:5624 stop:6241 length:618 start_codon:yes stop_codon:yes gene_type:complete